MDTPFMLSCISIDAPKDRDGIRDPKLVAVPCLLRGKHSGGHWCGTQRGDTFCPHTYLHLKNSPNPFTFHSCSSLGSIQRTVLLPHANRQRTSFPQGTFSPKKKIYIYIHIHIYNGHVSWLTVHCEYFLFPLPLHSRSVICHNESSPFGLKASTEVNSWWNLRYWMLMYYDQFDFVGIKWNWVGNYFKYYF